MTRPPKSADARHTAPKKRKGGWPDIPPSKSFTLWVPVEDADNLRRMANAMGLSVGSLVRESIRRLIRETLRP